MAPQVGPPTYDITVVGSLSWVLLAEYDNRTNDGKITESVKWTLKESVERNEFNKEFSETTRKHLQDSKISTEVGSSFEGTSAKISGGLQVTDEVNDVVQRTCETTVKTDYKYSETYQRDFVVEAKSYLAIYQQKFSAPGIDVMCKAITTNPETAKEVTQVNIVYTAQAVQFIKDINVVYGSHESDAPGGRVLEIGGGSDDINHGYGGKYVWLVPVYTEDADDAATRFDLFIQTDEHKGWPDLAKGAGGKYRYLRAVADKNNQDKVTTLGLKRSNSAVNNFGDADGHTNDINAGRALSYLYLEWHTREAW